MGAVVREINGVKGFCEYKDGIPYTYIYTRDAIEMLGLVGYNKIKNTKFLRINTFGEKYEIVLQNEKVSNQPVQLGITITTEFKISQVGFLNTTSCVHKRSNRIPQSRYDSILPEYILDRVIFAIANNLNNETAKGFRYELFNTIIPHFQQTATQDQIAKVPILNQTTQFMYDNTNYQLITQQSYNFAKQILDMHLNRLVVLRNDDNIDKIFITMLDELNNILKADQEFLTVDIALKEYISFISKVTGQNKTNITLEDIKDAVILNTKIYTEFLNFLIKNIRDEEEYLVMDSLNQERLVKYQPTSMSERTESMRVPKDPSKIAVTRFYSLNERSGM